MTRLLTAHRRPADPEGYPESHQHVACLLELPAVIYLNNRMCQSLFKKRGGDGDGRRCPLAAPVLSHSFFIGMSHIGQAGNYTELS